MGQFSDLFQFLLFEMLVVQGGSEDFVQLLCLLVRQLTLSFNALFHMSCHIVCVKLLPNTPGQEKMLVLQDRLVSSMSSTCDSNCVFFRPLKHHPSIPIRKTLVFDERIFIPNLVLFPLQVLFKRSQSVLPRPASGRPYRFRSRRTAGSSMFDHDFDHFCRGRRIHISGLSDSGILSNFGASSILA